MAQRLGEHVKDYFVRLNAASINIRRDYRRSRDVLDDHIDHFANTLTDTALGTVIRHQQFASIDNLESSWTANSLTTQNTIFDRT